MKSRAIAAARSFWGLVSPGSVPASETGPFLRRLLQNLPGTAYRCLNDSTRTMVFVSQGCRDLTGFAPADLIGNKVVSYGDLIHPDDRERVWNTVQRAVDDGRPFRTTYRIRKVDGSERWVWEQGVGVCHGGEGLTAVEGFITDITDRHELLDKVQQQERRLRAVVEQALVGLYVIQDNRFTCVNSGFAEIFGYSVEEMCALSSVADLVHPADRELVMENLRQRFADEVATIRYEFRGLKRDGSPCDVEVQGRRFEWEGEPAVVGVALDITERKAAERAYLAAQKMEALGQLSAGVAHDFNNTLAVIQTTADVMRFEAEEGSQVAVDAGEILKAVRQASLLCRQLMSFGRGRETAAAGLPVSEVVEELVPMLERLLGDTVEVDVFLEDDLPPILLEPAGLEEIVMNLVLNARDAMPEGGTVSIRAFRDPGLPEGAATTLAGVGHVVLEVQDTGIGISDDVRERLFEPYFTTKGDRGTGLGLGNVWRVVHAAEGDIEVDSVVGVGTTFRALLPVHRA